VGEDFAGLVLRSFSGEGSFCIEEELAIRDLAWVSVVRGDFGGLVKIAVSKRRITGLIPVPP
jgi:hypothetical protein